MENLKFIFVLVALIAVNTSIRSQTNNYQSVFNRSYEYEKNSNYAAAIKEMNSIYNRITSYNVCYTKLLRI